MSEIDQPRNDAGQYSNEKFGRAAELEAGGYTEMPDAPQDEPKVYGGEEDDIRAAADELATDRDNGEFEVDPVEYREKGGTGDLIDENQAVTLDKAARDLSAYHGNTNRYVDGVSSEILADTIDTARADLVKGDPNVAAAYGLNADEVAANAKAAEEKASAEPAADEQPAADPPVDGLDPEVQKALKHPQVRQAIEDELGKAETAKQQYAQALNAVSHLANQELLGIVPALQQIPQDQWPHALNVLREVEPETFERAKAVIERGAQAEMLQVENARNQAAQQRQQFETYAKAEDARFEELTKDAPVTREVSDAVVKYAESLGVDRASLGHLLATNPVMRNAAFQRMMVDAARYQMMKAAVPKAAPKDLPPVQRPGTKQARAPIGSADLGALSARLTASGHIDDALSLLSAQRAARR
ncbi:hypothetical protein ACVMAJ_007453 [Bradyrhizobium sp. USDA 4448]